MLRDLMDDPDVRKILVALAEMGAEFRGLRTDVAEIKVDVREMHNDHDRIVRLEAWAFGSNGADGVTNRVQRLETSRTWEHRLEAMAALAVAIWGVRT